MNAQAIHVEIDRNFEFFEQIVDGLMASHAGQFALLRHAKCVEIFPTVQEAVHAGEDKFDDAVFSVQEVAKEPLDLGFFSHANPLW